MNGERETQDQHCKNTLPQLLVAQAARFGTDSAAVREKAYGIWQTISWDGYLRYVKHTALGLYSLDCRRGEAVGLITDNHSEWLFSELGAQSIGAVTLNLFTSAIAEELSTSLSRVQATYVVVQDQEQVDKLIACRDKLSHIRKVVYIDPTGM
ncbi:MAG: AMP-binding protein, partial [Deltaproteobacteria bacterium]|nr:AMP-binding protein [Deltaproteobacteria bacterium]